MERKKISFTIGELHQLVWKESISRLAKRLEFNETVIRLKCKELGIPTPTSAYWSRLKFGKPVEITALPKSLDAMQVVVLEDKKKRRRPQMHENVLNGNTDQVTKASEKGKALPSKTSKKKREHPLVEQTRSEFKRQSRIAPNNWEELRKSIPHLSIQVSKEHRERALAIFDMIIKGLINQGYQVKIDKNGHTIAVIEDIKIPMRIREKTKRVRSTKEKRYSWEEYEYVPTGILVFVTELFSFRRKEYYDMPFVKLEDKADRIVERIIAEGIEEHEENVRWEIERKEKAKQEQLEKERRLKVNAELEKFKDLFRLQTRWHQAETMRAFLDTYEEIFSASNDFNEEQQNWLEWARKKTEWYDPFIEDDDELMRGIDRDKLEPLPMNDVWY